MSRFLRFLPAVSLLVILAAVRLTQPVSAGGVARDGLPPTFVSTNFTDVSVLQVPDPTETWISTLGFRYRVAAVGLNAGLVKFAYWTSKTGGNGQVWNEGFPALPASVGDPKVVQFWAFGCPAAVVSGGTVAAVHFTLTPSNCAGDLTFGFNNVFDPGALVHLITALDAAPYGNLAGTGRVIAVDYQAATNTSRFLQAVYNGANFEWQPFGNPASCFVNPGRLNGVAVGAFDAATNTYRVLGVGNDGNYLEFSGDDPTDGCVKGVIAGTPTLNDVDYVGPSSTAIAVGNAGEKWQRASSVWTRVMPTGAYTNYGLASAPNLNGIAAFVGEANGTGAVTVGSRVNATSVGPVYELTDLRSIAPGAIHSPSSNVIADLKAVDGNDATHWWAVGSGGTVVHSTGGTADGTAWIAPDGSAAANGLYLSLNCINGGTGADCEQDPASKYGLGIEPASGVEPSALLGRAWMGLAGGSLPSGSARQSTLELNTYGGVSQLGLDLNDNSFYDVDRVGDRVFVAGYTAAAFEAPILRRQVHSSGSTAGTFDPVDPATDECNATDYVDAVRQQIATSTVGGSSYIHSLIPAQVGGTLHLKSALVNDPAWCDSLVASFSTISDPNCAYSTSADFAAIGRANHLYVLGGTCGGVATDDILHYPILAGGLPGVRTLSDLPAAMKNPEVSVSETVYGNVMVVYDRSANKLYVARINADGTLNAFTEQAVGLPAAAKPRAVGTVGGFLLAHYAPGDATGMNTGRSVFAASIRADRVSANIVGAWTAVNDIPALPYAATRVNGSEPFRTSMVGWTSQDGTRSVGYVGPYLSPRGLWSLTRYDLDELSSSPGWVSFDPADQVNPVDGSLEPPPAGCVPWGAAGYPFLSRVGLGSTTLGTCTQPVRTDEIWGWARILSLKAAGERRTPSETDWGWLSLRGPEVSNVQNYAQFSCFDCNASDSTCAICQSTSPAVEASAQPTCSACSGCTVTAPNGTCTACTACYRYGVSFDRVTGNFHGYGWSGGSSSSATSFGRIAYLSCEGTLELWLRDLMLSDPGLAPSVSSYVPGPGATCEIGSGRSFDNALFQQMLADNAVNPFALIVLEDPNLTGGAGGGLPDQIGQLETLIQNGATVLATEDVKTTQGGNYNGQRHTFAGVRLCRERMSFGPGGSPFCGFTQSYLPGTGDVGPGNHAPFAVSSGDAINVAAAQGNFNGVLANSIADGGSINPTIDATYQPNSVLGPIGVLGHWNYGNGRVFFVTSAEDVTPPANCNETTCLNSSVNQVRQYWISTFKALAQQSHTGLGWVSFDQTAKGVRRFLSFVQAQYGSVYSGGSITSTRGAIPFGELGVCNAFVIQASGATISSLCSELAGFQTQCAVPGNANVLGNCGNPQSGSNSSTFNPGVVTNSSIQPFPQPANNFTAPLGKLDIVGLRTVTKTVGLTKYNKFGLVVKEMTDAEFLSAFAGPTGGVLGGAVYAVSPAGPNYTLTIAQPLKFNNGGSGVSGAGLIIVRGRVVVSQDISYETATVSRLSQLASAGWIVVTDPVLTGSSVTPQMVVQSPVTRLSGTFYVNGEVKSLASGVEDVQLLFHGPVMAQRFTLERNAIGGAGSAAQGSEVFIDDGRLRLNPPPGFEDVATNLPVFH